MTRTRQQVAAVKAHKTMRARKRAGLDTLAAGKLVCLARAGKRGVSARGHNYDDSGVCMSCGARRPNGTTMAKLQYVRWWEDSWRSFWGQLGVEVMRPSAREAMRMLLDLDGEPDWTDPLCRALWWPLLAAAIRDHKLRHPRARGDKLWTFGHADTGGKMVVRVSCRFCGRVLLPVARLGADYSDEVYPHVVPCAVGALATGTSSQPTTRRNP